SQLVDRPTLGDLATSWTDWSLGSQCADGSFGPSSNDDWWPRMVMLKTLTQHAEATGDPRVVPFLERYFAYQLASLGDRPLSSWAEARGAENALSILWLHRRNGDPSLLALLDLVIAQSLDWGKFFTEFPVREKYTSGFGHLTHVVNVAMGVKEAAIRYVRGSAAHNRDAVYAALANLDRYHGQATDMFSGDEWLAGHDPTQGVELCAVVEFMFSLEQLFAIFGDPTFADRLERVAYNNLPATITSDLRAHQYDQQWNQVLCSVAPRTWTENGPSANIFGLEPNFGCCTANLHQGWPKLVASLWMATADGGLVAAAYGPCEVTIEVNGTRVTIDEETEYPFGDVIQFRIRSTGPVTFPLVLRVPAWSTSATAQVNGQRQDGFDRPGFAVIRRQWRSGDVIVLTLTNRIQIQNRPGGGIAIQRGALTFALQIGEDWRKLAIPGRDSEPFDDWEVHPTTAWNYALRVDRMNPDRSLTLSRRPIGARPFDAGTPPLRLSSKARRVPSWGLVKNSAGPVPPSPVDVSTPIEDVTLVPYGS
ncbi:MAG TPA: beta-L-arabinofuranosidase domain-containing protein, partial [Chloroflexota bacterium]|nr:beta-L-arabinofuranosidase domain-containing protein [Chloroflexota bacterium]